MLLFKRRRREGNVVPFFILSFFIHSLLLYFFPGFFLQTALTTSLAVQEGEIIFIEMVEEVTTEDIPHYDVAIEEEPIPDPDPDPDPLPEPEQVVAQEEVDSQANNPIDTDPIPEILPENLDPQVLTAESSEEIFTIPEGDLFREEAPPIMEEALEAPREAALSEAEEVEIVEEEIEAAPPLQVEEEVRPPSPPPPNTMVSKAPTTYPKAAENEELEGRVVLEVIVSRGGRVQNIQIVQSSGHPTIDDSAYQTVLRGWVFKDDLFDYVLTLELDYRLGDTVASITYKGVEYIYD